MKEQAIQLFKEEKFKEALVLFEKTTEENAEIANYTGLCYLYLDDLDKALDIFHQGWMFYKDKAFIDNIIYTANRYLDTKRDKVHKPIHILRSYLSVSWHKYKRANAYEMLAHLVAVDPFEVEEVLRLCNKALELDPNNESYQKCVVRAQTNLDNSILGEKFTIDKEILALLDKFKKPCQVIKKDLSKDIETNNKNLVHVFSINNNDKINLPKEIKRLEVYKVYKGDGPSYKLLDDYGIDEAENMLLENSHNLPDYSTLEELYPVEHKKISDYIATLFISDNETDSEDIFDSAYSLLVKKYLGHELYTRFIGGNLNQMYVGIDNYKDLNFLMQYQTEWGNDDIVFVFNTKENPLDIKVVVRYS